MYYGKWRDRTGRQVKKLLGPAWIVPNGEGWKRRRGRMPDGVLDEHAAIVKLAAAIAAHEERLDETPVDRTVTFADAADHWLTHLEHIEGAKPTTLADYRYMLAPADVVARKRGHQPAARIMRTFGHRPIADITTSDIARFLARLDKEPVLGPHAPSTSTARSWRRSSATPCASRRSACA